MLIVEKRKTLTIWNEQSNNMSMKWIVLGETEAAETYQIIIIIESIANLTIIRCNG